MPRIFVTGSNRGLGLEFVRQYASDGWSVIACCRDPNSATQLQSLADHFDIDVRALDVADFEAIEQLSAELHGKSIDILLSNAGLFGPKIQADGDKRQSFGDIDYEIWQELVRVNTMAPLKLAECFVDHVAASEQRKVVALSSVMGSIAEAGAGLYAYRSSKAGLNMVMAALAHDLAPRNIAVGVFCPGWVRTRMGGPKATIDAIDSIAGLRQRIAAMQANPPLQFLRYNEDPLPW